MSKLISQQFGRRERILTAVATASGLLCGYLAFRSPFATAGGYILLAIIGTTVFLIIGRQYRAFYAGVFGVMLFLSLSVGLASSMVFVHHEALNKDYVFVVGGFFLELVIIPVLLGLFISWIRKHEDHAA